MPLSPRTLRPSSSFTPRSISGLALWLDGSDATSLYTTDAGPVTAVSAPTEISGCALWLDADDASSITVDGSNLVSQWNDKSGNARHATSSGSNRPTRTAAAQNGRAVLTFDGTSSQMQIDSTFLVTANATILAVAKRTSGPYGAVITSKGTGDNSPSLQHASGSWQINHAGNVSVIGAITGHAVLSGAISSGATTAYANGLLQDSDASSGTLSSDATKTYIGTYRAAIANVLAGEIAEIIVYNTALSTADRARVEAYLAAKWGISGVHAPAVNASDPVGYWRDKSGNGRHATQGTGGSRPTISATAQGGRKAVEFAASTRWITSAATVAQYVADATTSPKMLFAFVARPEGGLAGITFGTYPTNPNSASRVFFSSDYGAAGSHIVDFGSISTARLTGTVGDEANNVGHVYVAYRDGTAIVVRRDGAEILRKANASGVYSSTTGTLSLNVAEAGGATSSWMEFLAYAASIPAANVSKIERYLATRWGITLAPQVSNLDAQDWVNRVYANGGTVSASTASAVNALCNDIDAAAIRDRFYRLNPFAGTGLAAALVPLYRGPAYGGTTYGNATDTNVNFVSGDYAETGASGGLTGNGTSKYLDITVAPSSLPSYTSAHMAVYHSQPSGTNQTRAWISCRDTATASQVYLSNGIFGTPAVFCQYMSNAAANYNTGGSQTGAAGGMRMLSRTSSSRLDNYYNAVSQANSTANIEGGIAGVVSTRPFFVFANNNQGTADQFMNGRIMGYSVGIGLSQSQVESYYTAMQAFQTALGRNV